MNEEKQMIIWIREELKNEVYDIFCDIFCFVMFGVCLLFYHYMLYIMTRSVFFVLKYFVIMLFAFTCCLHVCEFVWSLYCRVWFFTSNYKNKNNNRQKTTTNKINKITIPIDFHEWLSSIVELIDCYCIIGTSFKKFMSISYVLRGT